ncbi:MAG: hypothetical protein SOZ23_07055 [Methanosphaera sp.]|uniref:hypothetical protein n=1 Tax=Methanosphaera sp. TaxID=2666342 RepID=UPI0025E77071|nr:hypothetical protein [Methanosphaera sp.]MCI5867096.1 DUF4430 domain-containing protein [Methanosphaera sp.]MDD6535198.1 hypothetical protein [Methanosphaera sp.]MDY3956518.1 hypothetical protein [Methanosphaera sp.]
MVELKFKEKVIRKDDDENEPMYVKIPQQIIDAYTLHDGDKIEWSFTINCKNQKTTTFTRRYNGID